MDEELPQSWRAAIGPALAAPGTQALVRRLAVDEAGGTTIHPPIGDRLRAFELTSLERVRVVILGQDPYHGPGQAMGLAFSVPPGVRLPPSLRNIAKELCADLCLPPADGGDLTPWAEQGVLLLNTSLTVEAGRAGSHAGLGWEAVTDAAVAAVAARAEPSVFILWGSHAQAKAARISDLGVGTRHLVIRSPHPSPLSAHRGFFGSRPFSRANAFLRERGRGEIDWRLGEGAGSLPLP